MTYWRLVSAEDPHLKYCRLTAGVVTGLDFSPEMVREAERRFPHEIVTGRLRVQLGDIASLPFAPARFDRVFTINTIYFWPDTVQGFQGDSPRAKTRRFRHHRPALAREHGARLLHSAWVPSLRPFGAPDLHAAGRFRRRETHSREARNTHRRSARLRSCLTVAT